MQQEMAAVKTKFILTVKWLFTYIQSLTNGYLRPLCGLAGGNCIKTCDN
jgi:hypothetical protein